MILGKTVGGSLWVEEGAAAPKPRSSSILVKHLGDSFKSDRKIEQEMDRRFGSTTWIQVDEIKFFQRLAGLGLGLG